MDKRLVLGLSVGGGVLALVVLHAFMHGQSAAASATQMGATLSAPFAISPAGGQVTNDVSTTSSSASSTATGGNTAVDPAAPAATSTSANGTTTQGAIAPAYGVPEAGWGQALGGMQSLAAGIPPWEVYGSAASA